jgi:hypothetical protein
VTCSAGSYTNTGKLHERISVPHEPRGLSQQGRKSLHPAVDGDVVDLDAALDQELFDVAV